MRFAVRPAPISQEPRTGLSERRGLGVRSQPGNLSCDSTTHRHAVRWLQFRPGAVRRGNLRSIGPRNGRRGASSGQGNLGSSLSQGGGEAGGEIDGRAGGAGARASSRRPASSHNYGLNQDPRAPRKARSRSPCVSEEQDVGRPGHLTRTYSRPACFHADDVPSEHAPPILFPVFGHAFRRLGALRLS